ncbi:ParA family protein [Endozoicomonas sp. G2_1]|uniref:ParA family protein n=1 Tax=Endozoicomonas sp. G2_1 TaxID=2821091 RepID=UPI001ADCF227|nr:ParA family protein [Endozoicomonas sp. G2_1]MBO9492194.1 ParA family protein [Endozoicomonas sp. G2_1]
MNIISVWNPKGGQGKSMLSINLAGAAIELGLTPIIIDQDPQGTSTKFYQNGNLPFQVIGQIPSQKPDADLILFDHQAGDWEIPSTPKIVMPLLPDRSQYGTYIEAKKKAEEAGKNNIITVVTNTNHQRPYQVATRKALVQEGAFDIPSSGVFSRADTEYRTIFDQKLNKAYKVRQTRLAVSKILGRLLLEQQPN